MTMDRLPLVQALTAAGLQRDGAEQVAIESSVATKADIAGLEARVARLEGALWGDIAHSETTLRGAIVRMETVLRGDFSRLHIAMHAMETRLTLRVGGIVVAATGALFVLLRFTGHAP